VQSYVDEFTSNGGVLKLSADDGEYTIVDRRYRTIEQIESTKDNRCLVFFIPGPGIRTGRAVLTSYGYYSELYGGQLNFQPYITSQWYVNSQPKQPDAEAFCAMAVVAILNTKMPLKDLDCGKIIRSNGDRYL